MILGFGDCDGDKISDDIRDGDGRTSGETDTIIVIKENYDNIIKKAAMIK